MQMLFQPFQPGLRPVEKVDKPTENELSAIEHAKPNQTNEAETVDLNRNVTK